MDKFFGCSQHTLQLRNVIERETGLNISYALASNKLLSKVATNEHLTTYQLSNIKIMKVDSVKSLRFNTSEIVFQA